MLDIEGMKRTVQVNVKVAEEDFAALRKAADKKWPDAVMTNSRIALALATSKWWHQIFGKQRKQSVACSNTELAHVRPRPPAVRLRTSFAMMWRRIT